MPDSGTWVALNISLAGAGASAIVVDVSPLNGQAIDAIKYAWGPTGGRPNGDDVQCCVPTASKECLPAMCPIFAAQPLAPYAGLPANPFMAQITACVEARAPARSSQQRPKLTRPRAPLPRTARASASARRRRCATLKSVMRGESRGEGRSDSKVRVAAAAGALVV